jgi:hypothetical protein
MLRLLSSFASPTRPVRSCYAYFITLFTHFPTIFWLSPLPLYFSIPLFSGYTIFWSCMRSASIFSHFSLSSSLTLFYASPVFHSLFHYFTFPLFCFPSTFWLSPLSCFDSPTRPVRWFSAYFFTLSPHYLAIASLSFSISLYFLAIASLYASPISSFAWPTRPVRSCYAYFIPLSHYFANPLFLAIAYFLASPDLPALSGQAPPTYFRTNPIFTLTLILPLTLIYH